MSEEREQSKESNMDSSISDRTATAEAGDASDDKSLVRKLDRRLIPATVLLLILSSLDRGNIGNALIEGLPVDLRINPNKILIALTVNFVTYVVFELPSNIILKLTSPRFWLPSLAVTWGIICVLTGLVRNFPEFLVARFFIGLVDCGLLPGVVYYMSLWYKRNEQLFRISLLLCTANVAGAFSGLLGYAIAKMKGLAGLNGWQWIFIIEGILTVVLALPGYFFIYSSPRTANFLTSGEKESIITRLQDDSDAVDDEAFNRAGFVEAFKDYKVWLYALCFHTLNMPAVTLGFFLPTIINELGYTSAQAQLLTVPPNVAGFILSMAFAVAGERTRLRAPFILASTSLAVIGYIILLTANQPSVLYGGTMLAYTGSISAAGFIVSWPANNISGQTKKVTASGLQFCFGSLGAVVGIQLYRSEWAPKYYQGNGVALGYLVANLIIVSTLWYVLKSENNRRDRGERDDRFKDVNAGVFLGDNDPRWRYQT